MMNISIWRAHSAQGHAHSPVRVGTHWHRPCASTRSPAGNPRYGQPGRSQLPYLDLTKHHIGWSLGIVASKQPDLTSTVARVARTGDVMLINVQVDATATCDDRNQVDLLQARLEERR